MCQNHNSDPAQIPLIEQMRVLIVDDEQPARMALRRLLSAVPEVEIAGEAANGTDAIEAMESLRPDAVFLDIEMPGLNGFDTLAEVSGPPAVVFVTAYNQYAVRAFEVNAVDYLLKPVEPGALARAILRIQNRSLRAVPANLLEELRSALQPKAPTRLAARRGKKVVLVSRRDILYVQAEERLVFLCTAGGRFLTNKTVSEVEALLPATEFFRVSRSTLVQLEAVAEMFPWMTSGAWRVRLSDGTELDVSRERAPVLREAVGL